MMTSATVVERVYMQDAGRAVLAAHVDRADGYVSRIDVVEMTAELVAACAKALRAARDRGEVYR